MNAICDSLAGARLCKLCTIKFYARAPWRGGIARLKQHDKIRSAKKIIARVEFFFAINALDNSLSILRVAQLGWQRFNERVTNLFILILRVYRSLRIAPK